MNQKRNVIEFLIKFFLIFGTLHYLLLVIDLYFFQEMITGFEAGLLELPYRGISVFIGREEFLVTVSCTGLVSVIILAAIIFSLKKPGLKEKAIIFLGAAAILLAVNLARLHLVLVIGKIFGVAAAETAHIISWFATTIAIIIAWYYFTKKLTKTDNFNDFI